MIIRKYVLVLLCAFPWLANWSVAADAPIESGLVILNGELIAGPYLVRLNDDQIILNNTALHLGEMRSNSLQDSGSAQAPGQRFSPRRRRGPDQFGPRGFAPDQFGSDDFGAGQFGGRGRRERFGEYGGRPRPFEPGFERNADGGRSQLVSREGRATPASYFYEITDTLSAQGFVVIFDNAKPFYLTTNAQKMALSQKLLGHNLDVDDQTLLQQLGIYREKEKWNALLNSAFVNDRFTTELEKMVESFEAAEAANYAQINALRLLENSSYPLTVLGMLLGAIALGHNLQWSAAGMTSAQSVSFLKKALILILAMSLLDLTWTILSSQAGQMRETNPFASSYINSPLKLIVFKLIATLGACGILYSLRQSSKVQQATWWMCLVCVLLTFRWIMMNSFLA